MATKVPGKSKAAVLAKHPEAVCVSTGSGRNGDYKFWQVWTSPSGRRLAGALTASEAWRRAAVKLVRENAPSDAELATLL